MFYESTLHERNCFVTLTYDEDHLPADGSLAPADLKNYLKRLRRAIEPRRLRYFAVGEYGDETFRPHYHAVLFGVGELDRDIIDRCWGLGITATFEFNEYTAQYTAGYTIKKMTRDDDPRLNGRHPEFARMSLRPGIGADAMAILADQLHSDAGLNHLSNTGDVPTHLTIGKRKIPIGRYLRQQLRNQMGMPERVQQQEKEKRFQQYKIEVQNLFEDTSFPEGLFKTPVVTKRSVKSALQGKIWSAESRLKIQSSKKRKSL